LEDPEIGCGSDDIGGAKPKRSLKFLSDGNNSLTSRVPSFFPLAKPRKEFFASLAAIFNDKTDSNRNHSLLKRKSTSTEKLLQEPSVGDTFSDGVECVSRGVQCNQCD
jgi:hypothetical protein